MRTIQDAPSSYKCTPKASSTFQCHKVLKIHLDRKLAKSLEDALAMFSFDVSHSDLAPLQHVLNKRFTHLHFDWRVRKAPRLKCSIINAACYAFAPPLEQQCIVKKIGCPIQRGDSKNTHIIHLMKRKIEQKIDTEKWLSFCLVPTKEKTSAAPTETNEREDDGEKNKRIVIFAV